MTKSRKNTKSNKNKKTGAKKPTVEVEEDNSNNEKSSEDYGGIPARDLKKNLGCG